MVTKVRGESQNDVIRLCNGIRRGDVLKVDLGGARRRELRGPHYCVVVSNDTLNKANETVVVVPLTTHGGKGKPSAYEVALKAGDGGLTQDGAAVPHQVRTIDTKERVIEILGRLSDDAMDDIEAMLTWAVSKP